MNDFHDYLIKATKCETQASHVTSIFWQHPFVSYPSPFLLKGTQMCTYLTSLLSIEMVDCLHVSLGFYHCHAYLYSLLISGIIWMHFKLAKDHLIRSICWPPNPAWMFPIFVTFALFPVHGYWNWLKKNSLFKIDLSMCFSSSLPVGIHFWQPLLCFPLNFLWFLFSLTFLWVLGSEHTVEEVTEAKALKTARSWLKIAGCKELKVEALNERGCIFL